MLLVSAQARVEDAPGAAISTDRIIGHWDSGSRAFWEMRLDVNKTGVDIGRCRHVAYSIIQSRVGIGTGSHLQDGDFAENWRTIAVELHPKDMRQTQCLTKLGYRILEFSIPVSNVCHADIAMFNDRAEFDHQSVSGWGVWGNKDCLTLRELEAFP